MPQPPRKPYHHGDLRDALIEAAAAQIETDGVEGFTLSAAAHQLGVSHAAAYRHFKNKAEVVRAVSDRHLAQLADVVHAAACTPGGAREQYLACGRAVVSFARRQPGIYAVAFAIHRADDADGLLRAPPTSVFGRLVAGIRRWQDVGWLAPRDPQSHALVVWAAVHGFASLASAGRLRGVRDVDLEPMVDGVLLAVRDGIGTER